MVSRDYPNTFDECVAKACTYSVQFFETKAAVENRMTRWRGLRSYWLISVNCSLDWIRFLFLQSFRITIYLAISFQDARTFVNSW